MDQHLRKSIMSEISGYRPRRKNGRNTLERQHANQVIFANLNSNNSVAPQQYYSAGAAHHPQSNHPSSSTGHHQYLTKIVEEPASSNHSLSFRSFDNASVADEGSVRNSISKRRSSTMIRNTRFFSVILVWIRNIHKLRTIHVCKAFYKWKYQTMHEIYASQISTTINNEEYIVENITSLDNLMINNESNDNEDSSTTDNTNEDTRIRTRTNSSRNMSFMMTNSTNNNSSLGNMSLLQKSSYLQLFAENEQLREQVEEFRRIASIHEKNARSGALKMVVISLFRRRISSRIRYYFDQWHSNTRITNIISDTNQKAIELEIGLQQVESERNHIRKTELINTQLKMWLSLAIYFFKWKSKMQNHLLTQERRLHEKQRKTIYNELRRMRQIVSMANEQEVSLLSTAVDRGEIVQDHFTHLKESLLEILNSCKSNSRESKRYSTENSNSSNNNEEGFKRSSSKEDVRASSYNLSYNNTREKDKESSDGRRTPDKIGKSSAHRKHNMNNTTNAQLSTS